MHLPHRSQGLFLRNLLWSFRNPHAEHPSAHRAAGHQNDADATPVQTRNRLAQGAYLGKVQGACFLPKQRTGAYFDHHGGLLRRRWLGGGGQVRLDRRMRGWGKSVATSEGSRQSKTNRKRVSGTGVMQAHVPLRPSSRAPQAGPSLFGVHETHPLARREETRSVE